MSEERNLLPRLRLSLPGEAQAPNALLEELLRQSGELIVAYTGRDSVPPALDGAQLRLAVVMYNRLGTEGESIRREGGALMHFEGLPRMIEAQLRPFRLCRALP
jgi:hypothetical protein